MLNWSCGPSLAIFVFLAGPEPTLAQEVAIVRIVIVDTNRILRDSVAARGIVKQVETFNSTLQADAAREEQALEIERADLETQRTILTNGAFRDKVALYEERRRKIQQLIRRRGQLIGNSMNAANANPQVALEPILKKIIADRGADLLLEKSRVAFHRPEMDITEEALNQLNQTIPHIAVQAPPAGQ